MITWGQSGGDCSQVKKQLIDVETIYSTYYAFAAVTQKGVVTWGDKDSGGDSSKVSAQLKNVTTIFSTKFAFAALKESGSVVT